MPGSGSYSKCTSAAGGSRAALVLVAVEIAARLRRSIVRNRSMPDLLRAKEARDDYPVEGLLGRAKQGQTEFSGPTAATLPELPDDPGGHAA